MQPQQLHMDLLSVWASTLDHMIASFHPELHTICLQLLVKHCSCIPVLLTQNLP